MRPATACSRCRMRKRKCIILDQGSACRRCKAMRLRCNISQEQSSSQSPDPSPAGLHPFHFDGKDVFPEQSICDELVDIYFDYMHDKQHALFHRQSFVSAQREGRAPKVLVAAIMALAARFSTNEYFRDTNPWLRGRVWAEYARYLFNARSEPVSLTTVQTCCILSSISFVEGELANESLYGALAIRMVQLLDLPKKLSSDRIQRETEIRVWWTIWMMDNWTSAGARLPKQLSVDPLYPRPMEEIAFALLEQGDHFFEDPETNRKAARGPDRGLWAQMIPLTQLMTQIVEINESTVQNSKSRAQILDDVETAGNKLDSWLLRLPKELQLTPDNVERYTENSHGRTLFALHLGFHHHAQVLYYQFLAQNAQDSKEQDLTLKYAMRCKEAASEVSTLLWLANSTPGCECLWVVTGHLLVISSSVHLHTLLFDDDELHIENARTMLKHNFELMLRLRDYWPSLDLSMLRLRAFHRACQQSMHTVFAMDHWMLLFLQRYMKPIGDCGRPSSMDDGFDLSHWPSPMHDFGYELDMANHSIDPNLWYGTEQQGNYSEILQSFL